MTRWRWSTGLTGAALILAAGVGGCGSSTTARTVATTMSPGVIAVAVEPSAGYPPPTVPPGVPVTTPELQDVLQIRSATTGGVVRTLTSNVGSLSLSGDGSTVYFESSGSTLDPFPIDRISTAGGRPRQVATGEDPAISPDGDTLAYATGDGEGVALKDLPTGSTRVLDLASVIGSGASFNNTPGVVTWLTDRELIAIPPADASALMPSTPAPAAAPGSCSAAYAKQAQCAIVIDLDAPLPAHAVILPLPRNFDVLVAGSGTTPGTVLLGSSDSVARLAVTPTQATLQDNLAVPGQGQVEGFSPDGRHVLYLRGHGPIQLWSGTVGSTTISPGKDLIPEVSLERLSW